MRFLSVFAALLCWALPAVAAVSAKYPLYFDHNGEQRLYYLNVPETLPRGAPLVVALHGMGGQAHKMRYGLGLHDLAFEKGFATLFPQGAQYGAHTTYWNAGEGPGAHDDLGFLQALITYVVETQHLDPTRVFVIGISNGAQMAYHLACKAPGLVAAIAPVIGTIPAVDWGNCTPDPDMSVLHIHGLQDRVMAFEGGQSHFADRARYPSVIELVGFWAKTIGARPVASTANPPKSKVIRFASGSGARVELVMLQGFGHDWPHPGNAGFSASRLITDFFLSLPSQSGRVLP